MTTSAKLQHGILVNQSQFLMQLLQVFLVGLTIGMTRTVIPGLAETEFGLAGEQFFLLTSFVIVFGVVKAVMNLLAGKFSEVYGRKFVLISGWLVALPIPFMLLYAPNWNWVIAATFLLGINQGLAWSMALNSKLDLARPTQKGLVNGLNEFSGYAAVGIAGVVTAYFVNLYGAREGLFVFSSFVILAGWLSAMFLVKDTMRWADLHQQDAEPSEHQSLGQLFKTASWQDRNLLALNQAGLVEKFTDALVWIFLPVYFLSQNLTLVEGSVIIMVYAVVWGSSQLVTGPLSDKIGRKGLIVWGMWLCGLGVLAIPLTQGSLVWTLEAAIIGIGMAMLYPNLGASVADFSVVRHRASLIGIYRFWRDMGYAVGALLMGVLAQWSGNMQVAFWLVGIAMLLSGLWVHWVIPKKRKVS
ncbi:MFS transporter [Thiomicrorhabdus sp. ZW0627]|uniref:MFS transporter n=1 Tax=Thiomicrorhabdus sp. ZW0627 TaxID=3039774 RepID=UPI0024364EA5|nr:MFS transporter [Thiomicrorhabdus sp. ZW0627]MDG6774189.1 MFS transporter [Thiomicrorhabdus sp. ZW0627]